MPGFLYFIPNRTSPQVTPGLLSSLGIAYAFDRQPVAFDCLRGPTGEPGVVVADSARINRVGYYPADQTWQQAPGSEVWVGMEGKPRPEDLQRATMLDGPLVELGDGTAWMIPVARSFSELGGWVVRVPRKMQLESDGKWSAGQVVSAYRRLWDLSVGYFEARMAGFADAVKNRSETMAVNFGLTADVTLAATEVLQVNYAIGLTEVAILDLWTDHNIVAAMDAASDATTVDEWLKKKAIELTTSDGASSAPGSPGDSTVTTQH